MHDQGPQRIRIADVRLEQQCPASRLRGRTSGPTSSLDRWKAVLLCITQWHADGAPTDVRRIERDLLGAFDPVQRALCSRAFRSWREHIGSDGVVDFEPPWPSATSEDGAHYLSAPMQVEITHEDGSVEYLKVKSTSPTSEEERAVITVAAEDDVDYLEILLEPGQVDSLPIEPDRARAIVDELFALAARDRERDAEYRPGFHCWRCPRVSACPLHPSLSGEPPPNRTPSVTISKSTLSHLGQCPRRVAWKALIHVPTPGDDEFGGPALAMGIGFHAAIATALLDGDPAGVIDAHSRGLPPSERADFLGLWDAHQQLAESESSPVHITATELPIGCTAPAPTPSGPHAVTMLGIVDAAGREADGTPAVVEHRTTAARELPFLEQELYAVAGALAADADHIAVHHHWLRAPLGEACTRRVFSTDDLAEARQRLVDAATEIASWSREDATSAPHRVGPWCEWCPYRTLCEQHRD